MPRNRSAAGPDFPGSAVLSCSVSLILFRKNFGAAEITLIEKEFNEIEKALSNITIHGNRTDEDIAKLRE